MNKKTVIQLVLFLTVIIILVVTYFKLFKTPKNIVLNDQKKQIGWGSQIRSYVLHPYKLIKDLRTNHESSNINDILDGEIDDFLEKSLSL